MSKKSTEFDPKHVSQSQLAQLIGRRPSWIRENSHVLPRNVDGSYDAAEVIAAIAGQVEPATLDPDDIERALQAHEIFHRVGQDEHVSAAMLAYLDSVERRQGPAGLLSVLETWREEWRQLVKNVPPKPDRTEAEIRADYKERCDQAIEESRHLREHEYLLCEVAKCDWCGRYRWGGTWTEENPRPDLKPTGGVCWDCFGK